MTLRLYKFQKKGVELIEKFNGRVLLADDMGLGKTLQSLFWAWMYLPDNRPIIVICPATIKDNWQRQAAQHLGMRAEVLYKKTPPKNMIRRMNSNTIYVLNYEIIGSAVGPKPSWSKYLRKLKPALVIIDECHRISNPKAKCTRFTKQLCKGVKNVLCLSGTPLTNRPAELFTVLNLLWPDKFPNWLRFANRYCLPTYSPWGVQYKGATKLPELHRKLKRCGMIRRRKADVLKDLPAKTRIVVPVDITDMKQYQAAEKDFISWLIKTHPHRLDSARRAERLVRYHYLLTLTAKLKLKSVHEWIDSYLEESDEKLLTFAVHREIVEGLYERYRNKATAIHGGIVGKKRMAEIDKFTLKKKYRMMFGNIRAAGTGWSAKNVSTVMFAELGWTPGEHVQAEDRTHGIGRGKKGVSTTFYYLIAKGTIEEKLCEILQSKQKVLDAVLDGKETKEGIAIMDMLEAAILKKKGFGI